MPVFAKRIREKVDQEGSRKSLQEPIWEPSVNSVPKADTADKETATKTSLEPSFLRESTKPVETLIPTNNPFNEKTLHSLIQPVREWTLCTDGNQFSCAQFLAADNSFPGVSFDCRHPNTFRDVSYNSKLYEFLSEIKKKGYGSWNLSAFRPCDVNFHIKDMLPESIKETLWPLIVEKGVLNFYESFGLSYLACREGGEAFRRAVAHHVITNPQELKQLSEILGEMPRAVLSNLRKPNIPTSTEIATLSKIVEKNITVFEFDYQGKLLSDTYFDFHPCKSKETQTVYIGCFSTDSGNQYFPLVRKQGITVNPPEARTSAVMRGRLQAPSHGYQYTSENTNKWSSTAANTSMKPLMEESIYPQSASVNKVQSASKTVSTVKPNLQKFAQNPRNERTSSQYKEHESKQLSASRQTALRPSVPPPLPPHHQKSGKDVLSSIVSYKGVRKIPNGLVNEAASCFVNATMQALLCIPKLKLQSLPLSMRYFYSSIFELEHNSIKQRSAVKLANISLTTLLDPFLQPGQQNDAHELLHKIFENAKDIRSLFEISIQYKLNCATTDSDSPSISDIWTEIFLQPNIPMQSAIIKALYSGYSNCSSSCNEKFPMQHYKIAGAPNCLLLVTQLFPEPNRKVQLHASYVPFERSILLPTNAGAAKYQLNSFITHSGATQMSGHFRAYTIVDNNWYMCDDNSVILCQNGPQMKETEAVYMQFFVKE